MRKLHAAGIIIFNSQPIRTHTIIALLIMMINHSFFFFWRYPYNTKNKIKMYNIICTFSKCVCRIVVLFLISLKSVPLGVFAVCSVPCSPMGSKKRKILFRRYRENVGVSKMLNLFNSLWLKSTSSPAFSMLSHKSLKWKTE